MCQRRCVPRKRRLDPTGSGSGCGSHFQYLVCRGKATAPPTPPLHAPSTHHEAALDRASEAISKGADQGTAASIRGGSESASPSAPLAAAAPAGGCCLSSRCAACWGQSSSLPPLLLARGVPSGVWLSPSAEVPCRPFEATEGLPVVDSAAASLELVGRRAASAGWRCEAGRCGRGWCGWAACMCSGVHQPGGGQAACSCCSVAGAYPTASINSTRYSSGPARAQVGAFGQPARRSRWAGLWGRVIAVQFATGAGRTAC